MPPYFSTVFSFKKSRIYNNFVRDLYECVFACGFPFKSGYTEYDQMSLDDITKWNQSLLEKDFHLGYTQHYKDGYKQILFTSELCSHLRGYWNNTHDELLFCLIVPENDVMTADNFFIRDRIEPFRKLSIILWENGMVDAVQTHTEIDGPYSLKSLEKGEPVADIQFAILNKDIFDRFDQRYFTGKTISEVKDNGMLIDNPEPWGFVKYWRSIGKNFDCNV